MDVKTTFLNRDLKENVYMKQPKGFIMEGKENMGCRLKKSKDIPSSTHLPENGARKELS